MNQYRIARMHDLDCWKVVGADNIQKAIDSYCSDHFYNGNSAELIDGDFEIAVIRPNNTISFHAIQAELVPSFDNATLDGSHIENRIEGLKIQIDNGDIDPEFGLQCIESRQAELKTLNQRISKARKYAEGFLWITK